MNHQERNLYLILIKQELQNLCSEDVGLKLVPNLKILCLKAILKSEGNMNQAAKYLKVPVYHMPQVLRKYKVGYNYLRKNVAV